MKKSKKILVDSLALEVLDLLEILIDRTWTFLENQAEAKMTKGYKLLRILTDEDFFFFSWYPWNRLSTFFLTKKNFNVLSTVMWHSSHNLIWGKGE